MISVALAWIVLAQPFNPYLEEGRRLAKELKFAECIEQMKVASQVKDLSTAEKLELYSIQARCQIAEGQRPAAEDSFAQLLQLAPSTELDRRESPKILEVFDAVKHRLYPPDFVKLVPLPTRDGQALFRLIDPWSHVESVTMVRRIDEAVNEVKLPSADEQIPIELQVEAGHTLDWWLEARDLSGVVVAGFGSAQAPQHYTVTLIDTGPAVVDSRTPRLQRAPAWVAVIAAVAACSAGALLQIQAGVHSAQARDNARAPGDWDDTARATQSKAVGEATWATGLFIGAGVAGSAGVVVFAW